MSASQTFYSNRYFALITCLVSLTFLAPLVDHGVLARAVVGVLLVASLVTATHAVRRSNRLSVKSFMLASFASIIWVMAFSINTFPFNTIYFQLASHAVVLVFFANVSRIILKDVLAGEVNANRICGSVCVYILIGFCFSMLQMLISISDPLAYRDNTVGKYVTSIDRSSAYPLFVYFSFCTLSTVGYGDIVPASRLARSTACLESITGQLYLTVLIARLVGLHIAGSGATEALETETKETEKKKILESSRR